MYNTNQFNKAFKEMREALTHDANVFYLMLKELGVSDAKMAKKAGYSSQGLSRKYKHLKV